MNGMLFLIDSIGETAGGIEGKILLIAEDLLKRGLFTPVIATNGKNAYLAQRFKELGYPAYDFPMEKQSTLLTSIAPFDQIIEEHNIKLIQSHRFRPSLLGRRIRKAHPDLRHVFRVHTHIEGHNTPKWKTAFYHALDGWTAKNVDAFVPISAYLGDELIEQSHVPKEKVHPVWNGVPALGDPDPANNGQSPLHPAIAVIGDLQERKQQSLAIEAVGRLAAKGLDIQLHLIGEQVDTYMTQLQALINKHKIDHLVHLHGYQQQEQIVNIVKDVPVFALPSLFEGVPTCIIEGMSMRKLVVTTPAGATEELVKHGKNGLLHPPRDIEALTSILENIFTTPARDWEAMRNAGYETWRTGFSLQNMMDGLVKVYESLGLLDR